MSLGIVVPVFERPRPLQRLLASLARAEIGDQAVTLVLSQEGDSCTEVAEICQAFHWRFGPKRIIRNERPLGLRKHILRCADLSSEFSAVILLEDDLCVGPGFLKFAREALDFYRDEPLIAGISLYSFIYSEVACAPFFPLDDGNDVYFVQSASSWGQVWTHRMWDGFRRWLSDNESRLPEAMLRIPPAIRAWPGDSWKREFNAYLASTGRYFVVPRRSYSTNVGEKGTHWEHTSTHQTAPLTLSRREPKGLVPLEGSTCRYDAYFELEPGSLMEHCPDLRGLSLEVDLMGQKEAMQITKDVVLTSRPVASSKSLREFGFRLVPPELNVILDEPGSVLHLAAREAVLFDTEGEVSRQLRRFQVAELDRERGEM